MAELQHIDAHVHLFTEADLRRVGSGLPYQLPRPHSLKVYLDALIDAGRKPQAINNVHLSILPDSENVFASFEELKRLQVLDPKRYADTILVGSILADPAYASAARLRHPQIKGIRVVLHDAKPESILPDAFSTPAWLELFGRIRPDQHLHVYAKDPEANLRLLRQVPSSVVTLIDHLGTCYPERGVHDHSFVSLLDEARRRGNVYFKGPGYRTSIDLADVVPFAAQIVRVLGPERLILEASDAPHVGADQLGRAYADHFNAATSLEFASRLAQATAGQTDTQPATLLRRMASSVLFFEGNHVSQVTVTERSINFPVRYRDAELKLRGYLFQPAAAGDGVQGLPPVVFNSGFTGGVSMYGQLVGRALAAKGYAVLTYDVAGFYTNKEVRNTFTSGGKTVTQVDLADQEAEILGAVAWVRAEFGRMPAVVSWAMGSVASLAAVVALANAGGEQLCAYVPMSYTRMDSLQALRADAKAIHAALLALGDKEPVPPFDTGTEATRLGFYPLDPETQDYVDRQLGAYTDAGGVERWPGCVFVSAGSYRECVGFDPESALPKVVGHLPPALIVHGTENTLHMPEESRRLHSAYRSTVPSKLLMIEGMEHGQQMSTDNPIFQDLVDSIDQHIRQCAAA